MLPLTVRHCCSLEPSQHMTRCMHLGLVVCCQCTCGSRTSHIHCFTCNCSSCFGSTRARCCMSKCTVPPSTSFRCQCTYCSRSKMWSRGQGKGSCREEPGMLPSWGAHHLSMPHHSCGMISTRLRLLAMAMAVRTCTTTATTCCLPLTTLGGVSVH